MLPTRFRLLSFAALLIVLIGSQPAAAQCGMPPTCDVNNNFLSGRWDISDLSGTYSIAGVEEYGRSGIPGPGNDFYDVSSVLTSEMVGGVAENYLEADCNGAITGMGKERISGRITKSPTPEVAGRACFNGDDSDGVMDWDVVIERTFSIEGQVTGFGELTVDFLIDEATISIDGNYVENIDCDWLPWSDSFSEIDITGADETESVLLAGLYEPDNYRFEPTVTHLDAESWLESVAGRFEIYNYPLTPRHYEPDPPPQTLVLHAPGTGPQPVLKYNQLLLQNALTVTPQIKAISQPKTPIITALELVEPQSYLLGVNTTSQAIATIDWRQSTGERFLEFSYAGATTTVPAVANSAVFEFDPGEAGQTISAVASPSSSHPSDTFLIEAPTVSIPGWAGTPADWSAQSGIRYSATLDWPISLQTTRSLNTISIFSGLWGISGMAASELETNANSAGASLSGSLETGATFQFAGQQTNLVMSGSTDTTLDCESLTMTGSANGTVPEAKWSKTINPLNAIPGLIAGACQLHRGLCNIVTSWGIKVSATAGLGGTGHFEGITNAISWVGGALNGAIGAELSVSVIPKPLSAILNLSASGGATGCITVELIPAVALSQLGGEAIIEVQMTFLGIGLNESGTIPFGDACGAKGAVVVVKGQSQGQGWVPADGQLSMALHGTDSAAAIWTDISASQQRPSGDIFVQFHGPGGWGEIVQLTDDPESDLAPSGVFLADGNLLISYQRSTAPVPLDLLEVDTYIDTYEIHYLIVNSSNGSVVESGQLTTNTSADFGPQLVRAEDGAPHLFWQRADDGNIFGTLASPVSIHTMSYRNNAWSPEETAANDLSYSFGWSAAAYDEQTQLIGITLDTDQNMGTADDREVAYLSKVAGVWTGPIFASDNLLADDSPLAGFDDQGEPVLLWRSASEVMERRGDLSTPMVAFTTANPTADEGVGAQFHSGQLVVGAAGAAVIWPESTQMQINRRPTSSDANAPWGIPDSALPSSQVDVPYAALQTADLIRVGYATRPFMTDGYTLEDKLLPVVATLDLLPCDTNCDRLYADGFEGP